MTYGPVTALGIDTANPVTKRFNFKTCTLGLEQEHVYAGGLMGTTAEASERVRGGNKKVSGQITAIPNPVELNLLLPWMLGGTPIVGTPAGKTTFPLGETVPTRNITTDRGSKVLTHDNCVVSKWTLKSTQGGSLELSLDILGKDEAIGNSGTFPAIDIDRTEQDFLHSDLVISIDAVARTCPDIEIACDNMIDEQRFFNSDTWTVPITSGINVARKGRKITVKTKVPFGDHASAYNLAVSGVVGNAKWTNGAVSLEIAMPAVQIPRKSPPIEGIDEVFLPLEGICRKIGSVAGTTDEISVILDLTP